MPKGVGLFNIFNSSRKGSPDRRRMAQKEANGDVHAPHGEYDHSEAVLRALQALADAHNDMEQNRDPDPKQHAREQKQREKREKEETREFIQKVNASEGV